MIDPRPNATAKSITDTLFNIWYAVVLMSPLQVSQDSHNSPNGLSTAINGFHVVEHGPVYPHRCPRWERTRKNMGSLNIRRWKVTSHNIKARVAHTPKEGLIQRIKEVVGFE